MDLAVDLTVDLTSVCLDVPDLVMVPATVGLATVDLIIVYLRRYQVVVWQA